MNTFLPYADYKQSARALDMARLGKQRSEVKAVLAMTKDPAFKNHPLARMWRGHEWWLLEYGKVICSEWLRRGYRDSLYGFFVYEQGLYTKGPKPVFPERYHRSNRQNLLWKSATYREEGWTEEPQEGTDWP